MNADNLISAVYIILYIILATHSHLHELSVKFSLQHYSSLD